jgi:hypothetical protein
MAPSKSSRRSKRKRKRRRGRKWLESFKQKLEKGPLRGHKFVFETVREVKMSEVLEDFVEPYLPLADTDEATRKLFALAVLAWNASFLTQEEQRVLAEDFANEVMPSATEEEKDDLRGIIAMLIERKRAHFSENTRRIVDFQVAATGRHYHLSVASTFEDPSSMTKEGKKDALQTP